MNEQRRQYAADLLERSRRHDQGKADRLERYRNLEPETAELLSVLIQGLCARAGPGDRNVQRLLDDLAGGRVRGDRSGSGVR